MIVLLSISQNTEGNSNIPHAPVPEEGFLPNPFQCVNDARKVPDCIDAVKKFQFKIITKECCFVLLKPQKIVLGCYFLCVLLLKLCFNLHVGLYVHD
ncbi:hypothetical protein DY000_02059036 [Brassica cretica]|uniref:Prolamin-like domain-containing protein n=1 Tax=Brassica cretica TaxID=69181 RepID=A0ABQ7AXB7_BRACR|nr:hypothetical protein DY000_02059036 [Brassica cretica]